ncbi:MAG: helix-turn-helix domain containing protein [Candidatus Binatia bacterium]|nr:helix-turn-helix domain containing protein [Candidatus Binatia bacterium]
MAQTGMFGPMPGADVTPRPLRSDAQASRATLLAAARQLIAERGMEGLTVVAVAQRAELNRSTAYQHFPKRADLVQAVAGEFAREVRNIFAEPRPFGEQIDYFVEYFFEHPDIARIWMFQMLSGHADSSPGWGDYLGAVERLAQSPRTQDGIDAEMFGVIGIAAPLVWSLMARQRTRSEEEAKVETARFARELKRLFLFGALRPDGWPELVEEFERDGGA